METSLNGEGLAYPRSWAGLSGESVMQICMQVLGFQHYVDVVSD